MPEEELESELPPIDVKELLQVNLRNTTEKPIKIERTSSRRKRDYVILTFVGNLSLVVILMLGSLNAVSVVFFISGLTLFNTGLPWVMFVVMDDY